MTSLVQHPFPLHEDSQLAGKRGLNFGPAPPASFVDCLSFSAASLQSFGSLDPSDMVYVPAPQLALQASNSFRGHSDHDQSLCEGKENWSRRQQCSENTLDVKDIARVASPATALPLPSAPSAAESDIEVEAVTQAASNSKDVDDSELKSSTSVSDWCAQMVCYIWFGGAATLESTFSVSPALSPCSRSVGRSSVDSSPVAKRHSKKLSLGSLSESVTFSVRDLHNAVEAHARSTADTGRSRPTAQERSSDPRALRLYPRRRFTEFVRNMLNTTQVSKSVIILALLYIHRLKSKNPGLRGQDGSEFRLFVTALMLANKFLDDHTYTNKTWSELSGLKLKDVTKMEIEFWLGLSSNIYISDTDFKSWIGTLENLAERRQLALNRHEQEKARQAALRQQQQQQQALLLHHHQQQQQQQQQHYLASLHDVPRRIAYNSRTNQSRSWSPDALAADHQRSRSSPVFAPAHLSPVYTPSTASGHRGSFDFEAPLALPEASYHHSMRFSNAASAHDASASGKRSFLQSSNASPLSERYSHSTPSPERAYKRRNISEQRASRDVSPSNRTYGLSPPFAQPYPRSVFEPLVSTPNTLLAPYAHYQPVGVTHQQKQHPLAYWQLAAGYDRGILGVHLPAPIACQTDYFEPLPMHQQQRFSSRAQQQYDRMTRKPLSTTTPYPTPPIDAFPAACNGASQQPLSSNGYSVAGPLLQQHIAQAPHAPFNNAEAHYVDPLFIRY